MKLFALVLIALFVVGCTNQPVIDSTQSNVQQDLSSQYVNFEIDPNSLDLKDEQSYEKLISEIDKQLSDLPESDFEDFGEIN